MKYFKELLKQKPKVPIYHYTSQEGLMGIINSKCIWATKIQYLNDELEFKYATELLLKRLRILKQSSTPNRNKYIEYLCNATMNFENVNVFVFSLSEKGDLLSQWRGYCPQDKGYCIGFKYENLKNQIDKQNFKLLRCIYNTSDQERLIDEFIGEHNIPPEKDIIPNSKQIVHAFNFANRFTMIAPLLKHPSFSEEKEWRLISDLISWSDRGVKFRSGKSTIIPYYEFILGVNPSDIEIEEIIIGPTPHKELSLSSTNGLMLKSGTRLANGVRNSNIPYRNF